MAVALRDVIVTSREEATEAKTPRRRHYEKKRDHTNGGDAIETVADDHNNNSIVVGVWVYIRVLLVDRKLID